MKELIQQMLIYIVIVSALKGLLINRKYEEYFRFFSGLIMILILLTPLLSVFGKPVNWFQDLEENFLEMDLGEAGSVLKVSDRNLEDKVLERYRNMIEREIELLAEKQGTSLKDTSVVLKREQDQITISEVSGTFSSKGDTSAASEENRKTQVADSNIEEIAVETIEIGENGKVKQRQEDTSKEAESFKKVLCNKFMLEGEQVHLWK